MMKSAAISTIPGHIGSVVAIDEFCFNLATPEDNGELLQFSAQTDMPGAIRLTFDRSPDYLAALSVEGRHTDVLVCREKKTGRLVATGHRSVKTVFVNGKPMTVGYLSGLRVGENVRSASFLSKGYAQLRALQAKRPVDFHLTTIMEDNVQARKVLLSRRLGLPSYHDYGKFCCMALSLQGHTNAGSEFTIRRAAAADAIPIVEFLNQEGRTKLFFPEYRVEDFGCLGGLLPHLDWKDVFLAFRGSELVGTLAAWDQGLIRRWRVTGYAPWLGLFRRLLNVRARLRRLPILPPPGAPVNYFNLALICIRNNDRSIFKALLNAVICAERSRYAFFLAGLHERDSLLPELLARPHVSLASRLYMVDWEKGNRPVDNLGRGDVPYLELGSL